MSVSAFLSLLGLAGTYAPSSETQPRQVTSSVAVTGSAQMNDTPPRNLYRAPASRSHVRAPLPRVTCWNGKVVTDHPRVQDCPKRPVDRSQSGTASRVAALNAHDWANQSFSIRVANCESGGTRQGRTYNGSPHDKNNPNYRGKWQFSWTTWRTVGGVGDPADASEAEQDYRAWLLWKRDGWGQWECASLV
jgi:hypothetical protein